MTLHFIGGAHQDFLWQLKGPLLLGQSHPVQTCETQMGGVAFNVAWSMKQLGHKVLVHSTGPGGSLVLDQVEIKRYDNGLDSPPSYHTILNERGDCVVGMAHMQSYDRWPSSLISKLPADEPWIIDTNLSSDFLPHLFEAPHLSIDAVVTSPAKAPRLLPYLDKIRALFLNEDEARALLNSTAQDPLELADQLAHAGCREFYLTLGERGVIVFDKKPLHLPTTPLTTKTTNGAGDTLSAIILHYRLNNLSIQESAKRAQEDVQVFLQGSREGFKAWAQQTF